MAYTSFNRKAQVKVEGRAENKCASIMATGRHGRLITRQMAYTKAPVSSGDLEPSGWEKKRTVSVAASTVALYPG